MLVFHEENIKSDLATFQQRHIICFGLAAAIRINNTIAEIDNIYAKEIHLLDEIWESIASGYPTRNWPHELNKILNDIPEGDDLSGLKSALVEDALSSVAYTIRCYLSPVPQEAAWAARRAYEAADQAAIRDLQIQAGTPATEALILSHHFVQRELSRQARDLQLLKDGLVELVREYAIADRLITRLEFETVLNK